MEYRNVRIDHGKVIRTEAKQYGDRKGERKEGDQGNKAVFAMVWGPRRPHGETAKKTGPDRTTIFTQSRPGTF